MGKYTTRKGLQHYVESFGRNESMDNMKPIGAITLSDIEDMLSQIAQIRTTTPRWMWVSLRPRNTRRKLTPKRKSKSHFKFKRK